MTEHDPNCEDVTGAYPGSCTCGAMSEKRSKIMDNLIAQDADLIEPIAQIDVDAAIEWYSPRESEWQGLLAEHFARHRLAERAAIVAWLRGDGKRRSLADWIEAGEHLK